MRRLLSIALVLLLAFPLVAPALGQNAQGRLLLCCRKGAAHHCMDSMSKADSNAPAFSAHCPMRDGVQVKSQAQSWMTAAQPFAAAGESVNSLRVRQVEAGYRISFHRSRQKRGPPATRLV